jgi:glycosyltransferase involved in cell wall biosynthesis
MRRAPWRSRFRTSAWWTSRAKGLVVARETGRRLASGDVLVYVDADCRAPLTWLAR